MKTPITATQSRYGLLYVEPMDSTDEPVTVEPEGASCLSQQRSEQENLCLIPLNDTLFSSTADKEHTREDRSIDRDRSEGGGEKRFIIATTHASTEIRVKVGIVTLDTGKTLELEALLDCGATGMFIDKEYAEAHNLSQRKLPRAIPVYNVDGMLNSAGSITHEVDLWITVKGHRERCTFEVVNLGKTCLILGMTWLKKHNPEIDWKTGNILFT